MIEKEMKQIPKEKNSLNTLSPYIGKMRPELASYLINAYSKKEGYIFDPFAGSGTVLVEGWRQGHDVIGNDLNYYAYVLTLGKTHPYPNEEMAIAALNLYKTRVEKKATQYDTKNIPQWVKVFFDSQTLKEICCWVYYLKRYKEWFLLSCLLGILHHQRPGFLSFPSSHGAPYLRTNKYPRVKFPEMYEYKNVYDKLHSKVLRAYKSMPIFNFEKSRIIINKDTSILNLKNIRASTIITSPPYMKSLTYARDNRLRLWFLGLEEWHDLDKIISPTQNTFFSMIQKSVLRWSANQLTGDKCIIVVGDILSNYNGKRTSLSDALVELTSKRYKLIESYSDPIPEARKVVKGNTKIKKESIIVLERK